ncbi:MAG: TrkA family potassium uptake protein [Bacillota bacterium]|nr:TrkA family potassium uptake protein [Bacillota bacterium]
MHIIVVGCGTLGSQLAETLAREGISVAVIDPEPAAFRRLRPRFPGKKVAGLGFDRSVLLEAGIRRADGLATVTDDDNTNFLIASLAREEFFVPKVVARIIDPLRAEIYQHLGVPVIAPTTWGAHRIHELLAHERMTTLFTSGNGEVRVIEFEVPPRLVGRMVRDLAVPGEITVLCLIRNGKALIPLMGTTFTERDLVQVALAEFAAPKLESLLD